MRESLVAALESTQIENPETANRANSTLSKRDGAKRRLRGAVPVRPARTPSPNVSPKVSAHNRKT
jgi:hypothetical protein